MAKRLGLGPEIRELKFGSSFNNNSGSNGDKTSFHTIKYDFKPASVDVSKMATVEVGPNNMMTVTVPHLDGAGLPHTVFKGSQRPYSKECVLIFDRKTGEITLEKLSSNIQVKKTRVDHRAQSLSAGPTITSTASNSLNRPNTPIESKSKPSNQSTSTNNPVMNAGHGRSSSRTKVTSGTKREPHVQYHPKSAASPLRKSPYHGKSPSNGPSFSNNISSPARAISSNHGGLPSLTGLPVIGGLDDTDNPSDPEDFQVPAQPPKPVSVLTTVVTPNPMELPINLDDQIGVLSDSSSSSGSSSDSSDSDSDMEPVTSPVLTSTNGHTNGTKGIISPPLSTTNIHDNLLKEDLQLSESESDSD
ncbi:hypothetical protein G9C98_001131 [Cotesia typhae]|uniref:Ell-associated factor Eaf n=1 Tax=Cotesia typhae TaxID=2053667 RepID=A0A8J5V7N6_9HYME|nr:hypothetical protein G9C98_001131 [Cotesia typhae]